MGSDVERLSFCELEVDVLASDILNKLEIRGNASINVKPNREGGGSMGIHVFGAFDVSKNFWSKSPP